MKKGKPATLKIGIQGWFAVQPYTGIGQHTLGLAKALHEKKNVELTLIVPRAVKIQGLPAGRVKVLKPKWWIPHPGLRRWYWELVQVPQAFAAMDLDWEYFPYPCPLPKASANRRAMTVHDLILWTDPRYKGNRIKTLYYEEARRTLVRMDQIFTVSKTIHDELGFPAARVLYNGAPAVRSTVSSPFPNALVYLGGYDIRKNVPALIKAFDLVRKAYPKLQLVLVGRAHHESKYYPDFPKTEGVIQVGNLSDEKVHDLLKHSLAFVHFSDAEGFNIPLLQAMKAGTPAIVRDLPINREISGNTALFIRPHRPSDLLEHVNTVMDKKRRATIIQKQKEQAKNFSWKHSAEILLKSLKTYSNI